MGLAPAIDVRPGPQKVSSAAPVVRAFPATAGHPCRARHRARAQPAGGGAVNAGQSLATFGSGLVGANVAIWDGLLADPQTSTLLRNASVSFVRYPGGSYGDIYHWQTNTAPGGYVAPNTDFDHYMTMV